MNLPRIEEYELEQIRNEQENLVWQELIALVKENSSFCHCRDCLLDIGILALNHLPPRYRFSHIHEKNLNQRIANDRILVNQALWNAIRLVTQRPHHDKK